MLSPFTPSPNMYTAMSPSPSTTVYQPSLPQEQPQYIFYTFPKPYPAVSPAGALYVDTNSFHGYMPATVANNVNGMNCAKFEELYNCSAPSAPPISVDGRTNVSTSCIETSAEDLSSDGIYYDPMPNN
ncbi:3716_t:CDS:1 [Paraglomus brasilianum]|uniref:3716_t:CDS:1 n=1 Tax=Paraglomus brasilianum TaxID=144538 RepID=A0A9N8Z182_9GLOM|nr:3716_t:CDS:1 [Paraglomus brasilianum]